MNNWTEEQRQAIYSSGKNIIVSAGAGSGKTAVLTERVIKKIESGIHINELLVLTFTKAAAYEMKDRIRSSLIEKKLTDELRLLDTAYITTFDSYALSVVKKYHYLVNISSDISIAPETVLRIKKREILNQVFDAYYEKEDSDFLNFINQFCVRDDDNIRRSVETMTNKLQMLPDVTDYLDRYLDIYYSDDYLDHLLATYEHLAQEVIGDIKEKVKELAMYVDASYMDKVNASLNGLLSALTLDEIENNRSVRLPNLPRGSEDDVKLIKDQIKKYLLKLDSLFQYGKSSELKANILKTKPAVSVLISLLKDYFKLVEQYKLDNELYEFSDIALLAIRILKDNPSICDEVKYSLKEILIDEYQDTNDIQEAFISLIANDNVYMVGDIKQSIYRFRNANPYIFKSKYDSYARGEGGMKIDLVKNFRSRNTVLDAINDIFNLVMDDLVGGAEYHESHQMVFGNKAYLLDTKYNYQLEILEYDLQKDANFTKEEVEIFAIAKDIKQKIQSKYQVFDKDTKKMRNACYHDFVILMDRSNAFYLYKKIFEYLGIPLTVYKKENLNNSNDLYIIKNLLTLLIKINTNNYDTEFKYALMSVARSFVFAYSDDEIFTWFMNKDYQTIEIVKMFDNIDINRLTPYEVLNIIMEKTNIYQKIVKVGDVDNSLIRLQQMQELALELTNAGYDIIAFNDYLTTLIADKYEIPYEVSLSDTDSVRIMNIHHSKGLEYSICYYSGLYKAFNIQEIKDSFIYNQKYGFIIPYFEEGINQTILKPLLNYDYMMEEVSEKIRLFYVALTRAREKMIILLPKKDNIFINTEANGALKVTSRLKYSSFADIMYSVKEYLPSYYESLDIDTLGLTKDYLFPKKNQLDLEIKHHPLSVKAISDTSTFMTEKSYSHKTSSLITKETYQNMHYGIKIHGILEHLDFKNYHPCGDKVIDDAIDRFLKSPLMQNLKDAKVYKELEFVYTKDDIKYHGIIDLMLEDQKNITIIDYKLSDISNEDYLKQLMGYRDYIKTKTSKSIKVYLYSILTGEIKEIN